MTSGRYGASHRSMRYRQLCASIARSIAAQGYPPSARQLMADIGLRSTASASLWLRQMRDAGLVAFEDGLARTLRLTPAGLALAGEEGTGAAA